MKSMNTQFAPELVQGDAAMVNASMSQVEMTVWLCVMAVLAGVMLALLAHGWPISSPRIESL